MSLETNKIRAQKRLERKAAKLRLAHVTHQRQMAEVKTVLKEVNAVPMTRVSKKSIQHGNTTVYKHSLNVAVKSLEWAEKLHINENKKELIRGALLHDYFLYDWHNKDKGLHDLHGFRHPYFAAKNAKRHFKDLSDREENIIKRHMFPLVPIPPKTKEGWIVCFADKVCSFEETFGIVGKRRAAGQ